MRGLKRNWVTLVAVTLLACAAGRAQDIPDAPQPKPPTNPFPDAPPAPKNNHPPDEAPSTASSDLPGDAIEPGPPADGIATGRDELFKIVVRLSFVEVPVTVKDGSGRMIEGLTPKDFTVYEDGVPERLSFFSSDPFPLSAAVVVDTNLPTATLKKVNETLPALVGAFSQFDEVALYRYGNSVEQIQGFSSVGEISSGALERLKRTGKPGGPPVIGGPFGAPSVNNVPVEPQVGQVYSAPQEANVLNDAILRAAQDLTRREKGVRRRIIFVISDGREYRSTAHYDEVKRFLLSQDISVYAVGVDTAALPVYDKLNRVRVPGFGYGDVLSRYASETGGDIFAKFEQKSIEQAYEEITTEARNQYTLGYNTKANISGAYHTIDVHVHRGGLAVTAKTGYYPLPPAPSPH
jgi:VWFA-related protein